MSYSQRLSISANGTHVLSPCDDKSQVSIDQSKAVENALPSDVETVEDALLYNAQAQEYEERRKRLLKLAMQELRSIQQEQLLQQESLIKSSFEPVKPLKSLGNVVGAAISALKPRETVAPAPSRQERADYLKVLREREIKAQQKLGELREPMPFIHPFWYARTAEQQMRIDFGLPLNAVDLLKEVYAAKVFNPANKRARTTTWYFGISHSGLYMAVSNWYDFRIYEDQYCLGKAISYWKSGEALHEDDIELIHSPSAGVTDDLLLKVLSNESFSRPLFTLLQAEGKQNRRITFHGSALGFIWSERVEGNIDSFNKSRYQICKSPPLFFASVSRYLSERKSYDFMSELDFRTYTAICKRINVSNAE